ncbi:MAG: ArsB/NhaD family transporter [Dehalococcoidales bacterium]|nr:ArsB/NhaD family transporter [Dehalococcoidales bacterium]
MLELSQILAMVIFAVMFIAIVSGKIHRYIPALIGAALVIVIVFLGVMKSTEAVVSVLNLGQLGEFKFWVPGAEHIESRGVNWQTIIFIGGMMIMVEGMAEAGFFRWVCLFIARLVNYKAVLILVTFMLLSGFLSMFIDSITVLLFLSTVTIELARLLKFDPVPVIVAEIFAANVGGSATMSGDPPNIIIGTALGYTFTDFAVNTGIIAWIGMIVTLAYFWFIFRKILSQPQQDSDGSLPNHYPQPSEAIVNRPLFMLNTAIFFVVVVLIVTHAETGLSMALIGVIAALMALVASTKRALHIIQRIDWRTLLFFIGLFISVGGLEETGVLKMIADYIGEVSGGSIVLVIPIILWLSAFASAIVDNIPFAATMIPVIKELSLTHGLSLPTLAWTLALGTDIGGNATPIGASANVVGTAIAEKEGYPISWGRYLKYAFLPMIAVVAMCWVYLIVRYA